MVLGTLAILLFASLWLMHSGALGSDLGLKERERILEPQARSSMSYLGFNCTNVSQSTINVTLYLDNSGTYDILPGCVDLLIDGVWIGRDDIYARPMPSDFDPMVWNPTEVLWLTSTADLSVGGHNATVISCSGQKLTGAFNASKCGDGVCTGGEYCAADSGQCDLLCYYTPCYNGCQSNLTIAGSKDNIGPLICNETGGCSLGDCVCDGTGGCCGAAGAGCNRNVDCCSGSCVDHLCTAFP